MATALTAFQKIQIGRESTRGTAVPAQRVLIANGALTEGREVAYDPAPQQRRATTGEAGVVTQRSSAFAVQEAWLTTEEVLWPLLLGLRGGVTPTAGEEGDEEAFTWLFDPQIGTGEPDLDTATVEFVRSDGVVNHIAIEAAHVQASSLTLNFAASQVATMAWQGYGRAAKDAAPTAALVPYSPRIPLVSNFAGVYFDDAWEDLGASQLIGVMQSATIALNFGNAPVYKMDGREDLDLSHTRPGVVAADITVRVQLQADAAAEYGHWRAGDLRFFRLDARGDLIGDTARHGLQGDFCIRLANTPTFSDSEGEEIMELTGQAVVDPVSNKIYTISVTTDIDETGL